jgi:site-specific DNA-methyltransferase (adenine-specific)
MTNQLWHGDCLELMKVIPDQSIDCIICDLPYGTTACKWDVIIPFHKLWEQYKRVIKQNRPILLFGSEPFSSHLRFSNIKEYKYDWYWDKKFGGNFVQAKRMPLKTIETISVFPDGKIMPSYHPVMIDREIPIKQGGTKTSLAIPVLNNPETHMRKVYDKKYPVTRLNFPKDLGNTVHPTQKPTELLEYLIKTYTNENDLVLDNCCGSGSTLLAAKNLNRNWIGIEKEEKYFNIAKERLGL